jgi:hypothetical protein
MFRSAQTANRTHHLTFTLAHTLRRRSENSLLAAVACIVIDGGEEVSPSSLMGEAGILVWPTEIPFDLSEMIAAEGPVLVEIGTDPDACTCGAVLVEDSHFPDCPQYDGAPEARYSDHGEECNCMDCRSENRAYANSYEGD